MREKNAPVCVFVCLHVFCICMCVCVFVVCVCVVASLTELRISRIYIYTRLYTDGTLLPSVDVHNLGQPPETARGVYIYI